MKSSSLCLLLAGAVPSTWGSSIRGVQHVPIKPKLDPSSDRIFQKDYVHDLNPRGQSAKIKFSHPYPMVQDTNDYDKDYVKDENNDDGEWKAQMEYDLLRTKISKEKDDYKHAKATEEALRKELEAARKAEEAAEKAAREAEERARKAQEDADSKAAAAKDKHKEKEDADAKAAGGGKKGSGAGGEGGGGSDDVAEDSEVKAAVDKVKKEMDDLENCQKELADARAKLKELMEKKKQDSEEHEKEEQSKLHDEAERLLEEDAKATKDAQEAGVKAAAEEAEMKRKAAAEAAEKTKLAEEEAMHHKAEEALNEEEKDMEAMEADIARAADRLRKYRKDVDSSGGVYRVTTTTTPKSGASAKSAGFVLVATIVAMNLQ